MARCHDSISGSRQHPLHEATNGVLILGDQDRLVAAERHIPGPAGFFGASDAFRTR